MAKKHKRSISVSAEAYTRLRVLAEARNMTLGEAIGIVVERLESETKCS